MSELGQWMRQTNDRPVKCSKCFQWIRAWTEYWRLTREPDGLDEFGADYCATCHDAILKPQNPS